MTESMEHEIRTLRAHFWSDRDPDGRAFAPLAEAYLNGGNVEEALTLVEDGLGRLPDYATGHLVAARVHRARGDAGAARSAVEALLALDRGSAPGLRLLGELSEETGEVHAAVAAFRQALERDPGYADLEGRIARLAYPTPSKEPEEGPRSEPEEVEPEAAGLTKAGLGEVEDHQHEVAELEADMPGFVGSASTGSADASLRIQDLESEPLFVTDVSPDSDPDVEFVPALAFGDVSGFDDMVSDDLVSDDPAFHTFQEFAEEVPMGEPAASREPQPESESENPRSEVMASEEGAGKGRTEPSLPLVTRTMAELFVRQGVMDRGIEVYRQLVERDPENTDLQDRLADLESGGLSYPSEKAVSGEGGEAAGVQGSPEDGPRGWPPQWDAEDPAEPSARETPFGLIPEPDETERSETEEVEFVDEETGGGRGVEGQPTGAGYLRDLLSWEPGAVPISSLAPESSEGGGQG